MKLIAKLSVILFLFGPHILFAQYYSSTLMASGGEPGDLFGGAVSLWGDFAIVGARGDDDRGENAGAAYIFQLQDSVWVQQAKLLAIDGSAGDMFGCSVALYGDVASVAAVQHSARGYHSGAVYVFRFDGRKWREETKLTPGDGVERDYFGNSVAMYENSIIVGTVRDDDNGTDSGSAYVFRFDSTGWTQTAKLTAADGKPDDIFGNAVSIHGDYAVIAALGHDKKGKDAGAAYLFKRNGENWIQQAKLLAKDGKKGDAFGSAVAIYGDLCIVGARLKSMKQRHRRTSTEYKNAGAAYVFERDGKKWKQRTKLQYPVPIQNFLFGQSVAINDSIAGVGAVGVGTKIGYVSIFKRIDDSDWEPVSRLSRDSHKPLHYLGTALSLGGNTLIAGAPGDDEVVGAAKIYHQVFTQKPTFPHLDEPPRPIGGFVAIRQALRAPEEDIDGRVIVEVLVGETGDVRDIMILSSTNPILNESVIEAIKSVRWNPAKKKGRPVETKVATVIDVGEPAPWRVILPQVYDKAPRIKGGTSAFWKSRKFLDRRAVRRARVRLRFDVDEQGEVSNFEIIESAGDDLDEAAMKVVKSLGWQPCRKDGHPVQATVEMTL